MRAESFVDFVMWVKVSSLCTAINVHIISLFNKSTLLMVANCFSIALKEVGSVSEATYHYSPIVCVVHRCHSCMVVGENHHSMPETSWRLSCCQGFLWLRYSEMLQGCVVFILFWRWCQGHATTVFCKISVRRSKYCLKFSITWGRLNISRWLLHLCTIIEAFLKNSLRFSKV